MMSMPQKSSPNTSSPADALSGSYEEAITELEALVSRMENEALGLEESLAAYQRGAALVRHCQSKLNRVEQQVKVLEEETLKPLAAEHTTNE